MIEKSPAPSRTFTSPSGRRWTAALAAAPALIGSAVVLRFMSDDLVLDAADWPADWETYSDDDLVGLLRAAQPPRLGLPHPRGVPQRSAER